MERYLSWALSRGPWQPARERGCLCRNAKPSLLCGPQKRNKKQIEERLAEIEDALRIFSQRRVLVRSDDAG